MPQQKRQRQSTTNPGLHDPSEMTDDDPFAPQRRMARQVRRLAAVIWPLEDAELDQAPGALPSATPEEASSYQLHPEAQLGIYAPLVAALEAPHPDVAYAILNDLREIGRADTDENILRRIERLMPEVFAIRLDISRGEVFDRLRLYLRLRPLGPQDPVVCGNGNCQTSWRYEQVIEWDGQTLEAFVRGDQCPACSEQTNATVPPESPESPESHESPESPESPGAPGNTPTES